MSGGNNLRLGPFIGGLNLGSDPTAIADAELVTSTNLDLDIDGSLVSRPPLLERDGHSSFTERIVLLCEGVFNNVHYLIGSNSNGVFSYLNGVWSVITTTFRASCAVQYADKVYLVSAPGSANPGGKWDPSGGFVAVAAIPQGGACAIHKERLFVVPGIAATANTSRVSFTNAGNFDVWPPANFIDIGQGDGTFLIDVNVYQDNLLLFKNESSYILAYDIRPEDATVKRISETIGVDTSNCVINYENQVYVLHNGWVYEIINLDFNRLNTKVAFVNDQTTPSPFAAEKEFLALVGDKLIARYFSRIYVYGLRTRTWSEWTSARDRLKYFGPVVAIHLTTGDEWYAGSSILAYRTMIQLFDKSTATTFEQTMDPTPTITDTFERTVANAWGVTNTGQTWLQDGGVASQLSVSAGTGRITHAAKGVTVLGQLNDQFSAVDITFDATMSAVALGGVYTVDAWARVAPAGTSDAYLMRANYNLVGNASLDIYKVVGGAATLLGTAAVPGTYAAAEKYQFRFRLNGTTISAKMWKASLPEPMAYMVSAVDATFTVGGLRIGSFISGPNTNVTPNVQFDNIAIANMLNVKADITCVVKTKNFDMAVPNQYKRLWWWGADVITNRNIVGTVAPITVSFSVTWAQLTAYRWNQLQTWAQPITASSGVTTVVMTQTGTARRFVKFLKSLRYRQINFSVQLITDGSTGDGPARLFTMSIVTAVKQGVSKGLT